MKTFAFWSVAILALLVVSGCGDSGPPLAKVTGTVTLDGEPVEGATVTFLAEEASMVAGGVTDAQGKFTLKTGTKEGAILGAHQISVTKMEGDAGPELGDDKEATTKMAEGAPIMTGDYTPTNLLPEKYSSPSTSGLTRTVEAGTNDFTIELTGS